MSKAFMKRGSERQALHEEAHKDIYRLEETSEEWAKNGHKACAYLAQIIIAYLFGKNMSHLSSTRRERYELVAEELFQKVTLRRYATFARAEEEEKAMLAEFALWLIESQALCQFPHDLARIEICDPQTIFRAPSAMSEV
ncbi:MAG: hypothetical protein PHF79_00085 [Candidatus Pacebacteria bacterium]|nr:hypothetical protein [Candidatus Paceibacterota bacterium]